MTGRDNMYLNGAVLGMRKSEIDARFNTIVDFAEMAAFLDTPVKRYSSGMYLRLAFAVAAHLDPEILIVDEVLAVGDLAFQRKCLGKMGDVSRGGRTVLFVSHNMAAVEHLCRTGLVLERGRLAFQGSAKEAVEHYVRSSVVGGPESESHSVDLIHSVTRPARFRPALRRLRLFTTDDAPLTGSIPIGGHFKAEIAFSLERPAANVDVALRFDDLLGHRILAIGSAFDPGFRGDDRSGELAAICEVASLILTPGTYRLRVALLVGNAEVDAVEDAARLTIVASDCYGTGRIPRAGTFVLPPTLEPALAVKSHEVPPGHDASDGWATVETHVGAMPIVVVQPARERGLAGPRRRVRPAVRPLAQHGANEAFGFAIRARRVGTCAQMPQAAQLAEPGKGPPEIGERVVGHHAAHADAVATKPPQRAPQEGRDGRAPLVGQHLDVRHA